MAFFPELTSVWVNFFAELIVNFQIFVSSTASLYDSPSGAERFKIGRILFFCTALMSGFMHMFLKGGLWKGPMTYPFLIQ